MPAYPDITPSWLKAENKSVLDSPLTKVLRVLGQLIGADDPASQVMGMMGTDVPAKAAGMAAKGIKAFHGSPHDFGKFSSEKIGTGEGAQAYGHGLYFAEQEGTARAYRDALSQGQVQHADAWDTVPQALTSGGRTLTSNDPVLWEAARWLEVRGGDMAQTVTDIQASSLNARAKAALVKRLNTYPNLSITEAAPGRMYEVNIKADPEHFLDWDAPLSQQPHVAQSQGMRELNAANHFGYHMPEFRALSPDKQAELIERAPFVLGGKRGASVYEELKDSMPLSVKRSEAATTASDTLRQAGIPGIKYLDQGSRAAGEGSRNYVVFDDSLIDILRKYGLLPFAASGAASHMDPSAK